jgi:type IV pilus assembly protein PilC
VILAAGALVFAGVSYWLKTPAGRFFFDTWWLKLPFGGELSRVYATSLFASSLSTILGGGTPLNKGLYISNGLIQNRYMQAGIQKAITAVEDGEGFARALKAVDVFPNMAIRMIAAGEEGGSLDRVLGDLARFYEKDVESRLSLVASTIEPLLMVFMGFVIGFIMLAMYMPIFQMAGTIG